MNAEVLTNSKVLSISEVLANSDVQTYTLKGPKYLRGPN